MLQGIRRWDVTPSVTVGTVLMVAPISYALIVAGLFGQVQQDGTGFKQGYGLTALGRIMVDDRRYFIVRGDP